MTYQELKTSPIKEINSLKTKRKQETNQRFLYTSKEKEDKG